MTVHVKLSKIDEDEKGVTYKFGPQYDCSGVIWYSKTGEDAVEVKRSTGPKPAKDFEYAYTKLRRIFNDGEPFPDETSFAS